MSPLSEANWKPYFGNNNLVIELPDWRGGGSVRFSEHLGKPLTQGLWEDLIHRICINGMCIYKYDDFQWTVGWGPGHVNINLDEKDNVKEISYTPHFQRNRDGD